MNRDTLIGLVLMGLVLVGFTWWNQPSAEQIEAQRREDSIAAALKDKAEKKQQAEETARQAAQKAAAQNDSSALFFQALQGTSQQVVLKNGKVELTLDTKGGTISKAVVKGFLDRDNQEDVTLFDGDDQQLNFMLAGKQDNIVTQDLYFTPSNQTDTTVTMTAQAIGGGTISVQDVARELASLATAALMPILSQTITNP